MEWTFEKPIKPGWYWYQADPEYPPIIVRAHSVWEDGNIVVETYFGKHLSAAEMNGRFAGPIDRPKEIAQEQALFRVMSGYTRTSGENTIYSLHGGDNSIPHIFFVPACADVHSYRRIDALTVPWDKDPMTIDYAVKKGIVLAITGEQRQQIMQHLTIALEGVQL
jgi:hypothetical protein